MHKLQSFMNCRYRRTADVRSVGYSELFVLSRDDVLCALKDHPEAEVGQTATNNMLATVKPRNAGSAGTEFELKSSRFSPSCFGDITYLRYSAECPASKGFTLGNSSGSSTFGSTP